MAYYAVKNGRLPGIYKTWEDCEKQVKGFSGAKYKKFKLLSQAEEFIGGSDVGCQEEINGIIDEDIDFNKIKDEEVIAYVDGSFDIESFTYSYGLVYITKEGKKTFNGRESNKDLAEMRNVAGELRGAVEAMALARKEGKSRIYLHYDYMGIEEWAKGNWKANKEGTKTYKKFYDSIKKELDVEFIKVKAHSGIKYNEEADKLAKDAL